MARPKGTPKTGGRVAGVPNKATLPKLTLEERIKSWGVDPLEVLAMHAKDSDKQISIAAAKELAQYVYAKKRAVEVSGIDGQPVKSESSFSPESKQILDELKSTLDNLASERRKQG